MELRRFIPFSVLLVTVMMPTSLAGESPTAAPEGIFAKARYLATHKQRSQALRLLEDYLRENDDGDARLIYGLILSWEGRWDDARRELKAVLAAHGAYTDAAMALANVALWSDHPDDAERLTAQFLEHEPENRDLMVQRVRALRALKRPGEALSLLNKVLAANPKDKEGIDLRSAIRQEEQAWQTVFGQTNVWFSGGYPSWNEQSISLKRGANAGSTVLRFSRAHHGSIASDLAEIDSYPHLWKGAYLYVNGGYSPDGNLYPEFRFGSDLYQSVSHGWEAAGGFRRLIFTTTRITVYTGTVGRYHSNWYFSGRTFLTPDASGWSRSIALQARRYFAGQQFASIRYSIGASPFEVRSLNEVGILNSSSVTADVNWWLGKWLLNGNAGWAREERINRIRQFEYSLGVTVTRRF